MGSYNQFKVQSFGSNGVVSGAQDAADGHIFIADAGVGGPVPSPMSRPWPEDNFYLPYVCMEWCQGLGMLSTATFLSLTPATSAIEVRDLHPEVRHVMLINLVYNMST